MKVKIEKNDFTFGQKCLFAVICCSFITINYAMGFNKGAFIAPMLMCVGLAALTFFFTKFCMKFFLARGSDNWHILATIAAALPSTVLCTLAIIFFGDSSKIGYGFIAAAAMSLAISYVRASSWRQDELEEKDRQRREIDLKDKLNL